MLGSEKLKKIRKELNLSQKDFGKKLQLSQSQIASYESGHRQIPSKTWEAIHSVFGISESFIETGAGDMFEEISTDEKLAALLARLVSYRDKKELKELIIKVASIDDEYVSLLTDLVDALSKKK